MMVDENVICTADERVMRRAGPRRPTALAG
jgi:hypothetical protein